MDLISRIIFIPVAALVASPASAFAVQYLSVEDAQKQMFPDASRFTPADIMLSDAQKTEIESRTSVRVRNSIQKIWKALKGETLLGYFVLDDVLGKHEFITYAVGLSKQGIVQHIEILDYRETYGGEIRNIAWRKQFQGKTSNDTLKLDKDIQNISGATLSCRHIADGVKRILALYHVAIRT